MSCTRKMGKKDGNRPFARGDAETLLELISYLKVRGYRFVTPTPASHARVLARPGRRRAFGLRDIFGWNMRFDRHLLDAGLLRILEDVGLIEEDGDGLKSRFRVSSLGKDLFLHSAFPTEGQDATFFGPDSYRFARLVAEEMTRYAKRPGIRLVDIGAGAGVGAIVAAHLCPEAEIVMTDINPAALHIARINARAAGVTATFHQTANLSSIDGMFDLVFANPPYIIDAAGRAYRDGGGMHGGEVSQEMAQQAVPRLSSRGRFILYTGSAIVEGGDHLRERLSELAVAQGCVFRYDEIDPDVFGEELEAEAYKDVDRIALVAAIVERRADAH